jgi:hypothetical protein
VILNKQAQRFINRKFVKNQLASKQLTSFHISRLNKLFSKYSCKELENMHKTITCFILYDLNNYEGRLRRLQGVPGTNQYTQLLRYGKKHYTSILAEQSKRKTNHFLNKLSTWINAGYTEQESREKVSEIQKSRSLVSPATQQGASEYSIRCVGYWMRKGYAEKDAKLKVSESQRRHHTAERNERWQQTLNNKSIEEKRLINLKRGHSIESYMARGYSEDDATMASIDYFSRRNNYSKSSQSFFNLLESLLGEHHRVYYKAKNYEKQFNGKNVDFYDEVTNTVVEYYGDFWHRNPNKYDAFYIAYGRTSQEIWESDKNRISQILLHKHVKNVIIVWESEVISNPQNTAEKILKDIKDA